MLLELLYDLTRLNAGRARAEELHVLQYLQQVVHVMWSQGDNKNPLLLESAIDCFVNLAQVEYKLPLCLEKILGALTRLAVHLELGHQLARDGAHLILQLLAYSDDEIDNRHVEQGIYALMTQLCAVDRSSLPVFMLFDVIAIIAERISVRLEDEGYVCAYLEFLDLVTNEKPPLLSLEDRQEVIVALEAIVAKYERALSKQVYRVSRNLLTNLGVTDPDPQKLVSSAKSLPIHTAPQLSEQELRFRELLLQGALFRVLSTTTDAKKHTKKKQPSARSKPPATRSSSHDYNKKQEQLKIWTENQHYLRSQEKRRISFQQEVLKAQMSPQACLGGKAAKVEAQSSRSPSATRKDVVNAMTSVQEGTNHSDLPHATAANHRRIMMLRQQRSAPSLEQQQLKVRRGPKLTKQPGNQQENSMLRPQDQDIVDVHFTLSRARNKRLEIDFGVDLTAIGSGAFSPAVELESALDAMPLDESPVSLQSNATIFEHQILIGAPDVCKAEEQTCSQVVDYSEQPECTFGDNEINAAVFDALQDSIDQVADAFANEMESCETTEDLGRDASESMAFQTEESTELPLLPPEMAGDLTDIEAARSAAMPPSVKQASSVGTIGNIEELKPSQGQTVDPMVHSPPEMAAQAASNQRNEDESFAIGNGDQAADSVVAPLVSDGNDTPAVESVSLSGDVVEPLPDASEESPTAAAQHDGEGEDDYEEEPFDDDAGHANETHDTPAGGSPQSNGEENGEHEPSSDTTAAAILPNDAEDDASGYGSEFDNDHNDDEAATAELKIGEARLHDGDYDNESYDNDDDGGDKSDPEVIATRREHETRDTYSDDGFSDGDDT
uniref:Uncharacterized protein n=1 Tax=Globisporangium ultimum (strain ATCC 200006 / CBS 805.95 / DAOM BR144) TaxID=431595 RepID=K3WK30_GLOUD